MKKTDELARLQNLVQDLFETIECFEQDLVLDSSAKPTRKDQVAALLRTGRRWSIADLAAEIGLEGDAGRRNISSILTALRKMGMQIGRDSKNRLFLEGETDEMS